MWLSIFFWEYLVKFRNLLEVKICFLICNKLFMFNNKWYLLREIVRKVWMFMWKLLDNLFIMGLFGNWGFVMMKFLLICFSDVVRLMVLWINEVWFLLFFVFDVVIRFFRLMWFFGILWDFVLILYKFNIL